MRMKQRFEGGDRKEGERDAKDYYVAVAGEQLPHSWVVVSKLGTGVYSSVFRCKRYEKDLGRDIFCAVKIIRKLPMMKTVAIKEIEMYKVMARDGPEVDPFGAHFVM